VLGDPAARPGIAGTAYDTAWLASVPGGGTGSAPRFPGALQWLVAHQRVDGSWGGALRYEHDRLLSTLAALPPLALRASEAGYEANVQRGTRYLWQHGHLLAGEPVELVGFELLLPALVQRARAAGIAVPQHLDVYREQREQKLRMLPPTALYSAGSTVAHSLEFLGDQADPAGLRAAQGENGALGNSPAATAYFYARTEDPRALAYLRECLVRTGGGMAPAVYPCETFETLWAAYHLSLAGVPARFLLDGTERAALRRALAEGGVGLSATFPIPDADETAVALLLLADLGEAVDPGVLQRFATPDGHFAAFPYERHGSVGVNFHVLHVLARVPGYPDADRVIVRLLAYLAARQEGGLYWLDKWHISPYYATAHAVRVLGALPARYATHVRPLLASAREWLRQTQNPDGSWGFYGRATAEETAYAVLALAGGAGDGEAARDDVRCAQGLRYLDAVPEDADLDQEEIFPPLWIDKGLYQPMLVVRAVIAAAHVAHRALQPVTGRRGGGLRTAR
jgi:halimadienyl-diphosphate synthase